MDPFANYGNIKNNFSFITDLVSNYSETCVHILITEESLISIEIL